MIRHGRWEEGRGGVLYKMQQGTSTLQLNRKTFCRVVFFYISELSYLKMKQCIQYCSRVPAYPASSVMGPSSFNSVLCNFLSFHHPIDSWLCPGEITSTSSQAQGLRNNVPDGIAVTGHVSCHLHCWILLHCSQCESHHMRVQEHKALTQRRN